jgi:hypothetical protein
MPTPRLTSEEIDRAYQDFLAKGNQVDEIPGFQATTPQRTSHGLHQGRHRRRRTGGRPMAERGPDGLTEAMAKRADKYEARIRELATTGHTGPDIAERLGISLYSVTAIIKARQIPQRSQGEVEAVRIVELIVQGFVEGYSLLETCRAFAINPHSAYHHYARYVEDNPAARRLAKGYADRELTRTENVALMILLHQELTGDSLPKTLRLLRVGRERAEWLLQQDSVSRQKKRMG